MVQMNLFSSRNRDKDVESKWMDTKEVKEEGGKNGEIEIDA